VGDRRLEFPAPNNLPDCRAPGASHTFMEGWKAPVQAAIEAVREMYPQARNVLLEEVGKTDSGDWEITVSFILPDIGTMDNLFGRSKTYKEFVIDPANNFKSMKIRSVA
jgi:hypothetical protein